MFQPYTPEQWYSLGKILYEIIRADMESASSEDLPQLYPQLIIMYEFFRLVRGEAFYSTRPSGLGDNQQKLYQMEDDLSRQLKQLRERLNPKDGRTAYYLNLMGKSFDLESPQTIPPEV